jgi:hypothetical protein
MSRVLINEERELDWRVNGPDLKRILTCGGIDLIECLSCVVSLNGLGPQEQRILTL